MTSNCLRSGTALVLAALVAFVLSAISAALTTYLAVALPTSQLSTYGISLAAAVVDLVGLGSLALFIVTKCSAAASRSHWLLTTVFFATALLELLGLGLTVGMLGHTIKQHNQHHNVKVATNLLSTVAGNLVFALLAAIAQGSFFALELASERPSPHHETLHSRMHSSLERYSEPSRKETRQATPPTALQNFTPSFAGGPTSSSSPIQSPRSSVAKSSLRDSLQQVIRPVTSRTKLLKRSSLRDSKSISSLSYSVETSHSDGFDTWDTSTVDQQDKETVLHSQGTGLETIPGSRSTSPARAFDGDLAEDGSKESSTRAEMLAMSLPPSPSSERRQQRSITPRPSSIRSPTIRESRSSTPDESHIHPLFRSDSPAPPSATPGTVITASPQGGQILTGEQVRVRSSSSRPTSRLAHSQSFDSYTGREKNGPETPPIPGFVLAEGVFAGSEPRGRAASASTARSRAMSMRSERTVGRAESLWNERREDGALMEE